MYVDLIIFIAILVFVLIYSKYFQGYIFGIAMMDIFFRVLNFLKNNIPISDIKGYISGYVPESIPNVINKYTSDTINMLLMWAYVVTMIIFLYFVIKIFVKRKKIG